jgi:hypothetical protein
MGRDNKQQPKNKRAKFNLALVGEALPGMFETVATLAAVFGVAFQSSDATQRFQLLGLVASAGFLAFRGGYTYQESLLRLRPVPAPQLQIGPNPLIEP